MAQKPVVILDTVGSTLDVPQGTDTYLLAEDVEIVGDLTISGTVDGRDVAADGTTLDGAVLESDYNAQTILAATTDNTPAALTVGEQTLVGRITGGNVAALTATQVRTLINVADGATVGAFTATDTKITPTTAITLNDATGNEVALNLAYQVNKATSGNDTGLVINQTDTASPGTSLLADFQVGGVSKASIDNTGKLTVPDGSSSINSISSATPYSGMVTISGRLNVSSSSGSWGSLLNLDGLTLYNGRAIGLSSGNGAPDTHIRRSAAGVVGITNALRIGEAAGYTVATLPTATVGTIARITDGDASLAWGATAVNSGAGGTPYLVWYNGSAWTILGK